LSASPLYLSAPIALAAAEGEDLPRRFSGLAYSGGLVEDWNFPIVIDLAATSIADGLPLLYRHDQERDIGTIDGVTNDGASLSVSGELFSDLDDDARKIAAKSKRKARYQMSVGLFGASHQEVKTGSVEINGRTLQAPITVLRGGIVREVSIVPLGADRNTNAAFFAAQSTPATEAEKMPESESASSEVEDLKKRLAEAIARAEKAEAALKKMEDNAREAELSAVLPSLSDAEKAIYMGLSAEQWGTIKTALAAKPSAPELPAHLFQAQALGDPNAKGPDDAKTIEQINAEIIAKFSGKGAK
jgi:hypothetical protein